jgi:hypothetical protein
MTNELRDIRAAVARQCSDWVKFVATQDSADTTIFTDDRAGYENDHHFRGSDLWFLNDAGTAANRGIQVRVADSAMATASLDLRAGLATAPLTGDEAWLFNIGGAGHHIHAYDAAINDAIRGLGEAGFPVYSELIPTVWDETVTWWDIPEAFTHVGTALYYDITDNWNDIPSHAIAVDQVTKQFAIAPEYAYLANGYDVTLLGRTTPTPLEDDTDTTDVDFEWLVSEAAASLLLQDRSQLMINKGGMLKNAADALRGKAGPLSLIEGMVRVR